VNGCRFGLLYSPRIGYHGVNLVDPQTAWPYLKAQEWLLTAYAIFSRPSRDLKTIGAVLLVAVREDARARSVKAFGRIVGLLFIGVHIASMFSHKCHKPPDDLLRSL
jgi:hypothetical protein